MRPGSSSRRCIGFTVTELLVAIAIIAVLLAITLPALLGTRENARELIAFSHQRESGALLRQHGFDYEDTFPFFGIAGTLSARLCLDPLDPFAQIAPPGSTPPCIGLSYWDQPKYWAKHLRFLGYDTEFMALPPEIEHDDPVVLGTVDFVTYGAYAPPHYWHPDSDQSFQHHNVQRWASVEYPSDKVILQRPNYVRDPEGDDVAGPVISWFADGHVEPLRKIDMRTAVPLQTVLTGGWPGLTTLGGLSGRDK